MFIDGVACARARRSFETAICVLLEEEKGVAVEITPVRLARRGANAAVDGDAVSDLQTRSLREAGIGKRADAGAVVKHAHMLWTLDRIRHHKSVGEINFLMGATSVRTKKVFGRATIDGEGSAIMIEADDLFGIDVIE